MKRMMRQAAITVLWTVLGASAWGGGKDDPLLTMVKFDQLETRDAEGHDPTVLEGSFWWGYDLHKLWLKAELEKSQGETEELELQVLHSRAILPYWDLQWGLRKDAKPTPDREWLVLGAQGLAPYFFEVDAALFLGGAGRSALRLEAEYELMFTQRWVLSPEIEVNAHGFNDPATGVGSGLSDVEAGIRLRYEIRREFAPYIGMHWHKRYGNTADFASAVGEDVEDSQIVLGVRFWY